MYMLGDSLLLKLIIEIIQFSITPQENTAIAGWA
jgi:hypothetical protein